MAKKALIEDTDHGWLLWCPGCKGYHLINHRWKMTGTTDCPTFHPSVLSRWPGAPGEPDHVCHLYVRAGRIEYLSDCTHDLAGRKVAMQPEPDE